MRITVSPRAHLVLGQQLLVRYLAVRSGVGILERHCGTVNGT
jgi:hypothetical protein